MAVNVYISSTYPALNILLCSSEIGSGYIFMSHRLIFLHSVHSSTCLFDDLLSPIVNLQLIQYKQIHVYLCRMSRVLPISFETFFAFIWNARMSIDAKHDSRNDPISDVEFYFGHTFSNQSSEF